MTRCTLLLSSPRPGGAHGEHSGKSWSWLSGNGHSFCLAPGSPPQSSRARRVLHPDPLCPGGGGLETSTPGTAFSKLLARCGRDFADTRICDGNFAAGASVCFFFHLLPRRRELSLILRHRTHSFHTPVSPLSLSALLTACPSWRTLFPVAPFTMRPVLTSCCSLPNFPNPAATQLTFCASLCPRRSQTRSGNCASSQKNTPFMVYQKTRALGCGAFDLGFLSQTENLQAHVSIKGSLKKGRTQSGHKMPEYGEAQHHPAPQPTHCHNRC